MVVMLKNKTFIVMVIPGEKTLAAKYSISR